MGYDCEGVKKSPAGNHYYEPGDMPRARIPIGECTGMTLSPTDLDKIFGINEHTMLDLPAFLVQPRLTSEWTTSDWSTVRGEIVIVKPIRWVPTVARVHTYSKSAGTATVKRTVQSIETRKLYPGVSGFVTASEGRVGVMSGVKLDVYPEYMLDGKESKELAVEDVEERAVEWKSGDEVVYEVAVGMTLAVEEVYSRGIEVQVKNWLKEAHSLAWGPNTWPVWDEVRVPNWEVERVKDIEFHPVHAQGNRYPENMFILALPVLDQDKSSVAKLHLLLSNMDWSAYYAYTLGPEGASKGSDLIAWASFKPVATLIPVSELTAENKELLDK